MYTGTEKALGKNHTHAQRKNPFLSPKALNVEWFNKMLIFKFKIFILSRRQFAFVIREVVLFRNIVANVCGF